MGRFTSRLSLKLIAVLVGSMLAVFLVVGYQNVNLHRKHLEELTFQSADSINGIIRASMRNSMLANHRQDIFETIMAIGVERGIHGIRIFNKEGRISFSSDRSEIDKLVDKNAEACYKCHAAEQPLTRLNRPDRVRIFENGHGERVLGVIQPIENEASCYEANCHAHDGSQRVLGVLDVTMNLSGVDTTIAEGQRDLIINMGVAVWFVAAIFAVLIWLMVDRPVSRLFLGTRKVAAGDLSHKLPVTSSDEIGQLARSFNHMMDEIQRMNRELKSWATTLETRVNEKTAQLRSAHEKMLQVERMASMGKLAAIVAHEINNPLMGILAAARVLLKRLETLSLQVENRAFAQENLEMIAAESSRCGEIVKGLLQFARQRQGKCECCDLSATVQESLRLVRHKLGLASVEVSASYPESPALVMADPQEIKQALVAILINACEAMQHGGGLLEVEVKTDVAERKSQVSIGDNGVGMDEVTREHIFEPFFSTKTQTSGVGLGLAVASGIITRHSGSIAVESAPGQGARFTVVLPMDQPSHEM